MFSFSNFWEFDALLLPTSPPPPPMNQKPGKANFRELVSKKIPGGACPRAPLEACSLGPLFRKSVSIYPRSAPAGYVFLRFSPLLDPGSQTSLACRANRASQNLKLFSLFFPTLKGYRENWGTVKALTFSRLRIVAICVSLANLSLIVHWVTAVK